MTDQRTPDDRLSFDDAQLRDLTLSLQADGLECGEHGCIDHEVCLAPSVVLALLDRLRVAESAYEAGKLDGEGELREAWDRLRVPPLDAERLYLLRGSLSRDNPKSRWHEEDVTKRHRSSWACVPIVDAASALEAALAAALSEPVSREPEAGS